MNIEVKVLGVETKTFTNVYKAINYIKYHRSEHHLLQWFCEDPYDNDTIMEYIYGE